MLSIEQSLQGDISIIEANGSLDNDGALALGSFLKEQIAEGKHSLVLNLQAVDYIGADGLWELKTALKHARFAGGDLRLAGPNDQLWQALEASALNQLFQIYETLAAAVASY